MKKIIKNPEPLLFMQWKANANQDWKPTWSKFQRPEKSAVRDSLLEEQGFICCYCGQAIDKTSSHIEHFIAGEGENDPYALDYGNLLESCQVSRRGTTTPNHCGVARKNKPLPVSPLDPEVESRFIYHADGQISSQEADLGAKEAIQLLRLDHDPLVGKRKGAIEGTLFEVDGTPVSPEDLYLVLSALSRRGTDGKFKSFSHAIRMACLSLANP